MSLFLAALLLMPPTRPLAVSESPVTIRVLHFSDYHSHAHPFPVGEEPQAAGLARALAFLKPLAKDPKTLIVSGGDMLNRGSPAWSDKYGCIEWPWMNGIVSAMAYGNHDADYGAEAFDRCRKSVRFPILSANTLRESGQPFFLPHAVFTRSGMRIGIFAVAGPDFGRLIKNDALPEKNVRFEDPVEAARRVVKTLRESEKVNTVILIGHQHRVDDFELAAKVPGIDLILGTHSHVESGLEKIPGTETWTLSAGPYLTSLADVVLTFLRGKLVTVDAKLVRMSQDRKQDATVTREVLLLQRELNADPVFAHLFVPFGKLQEGLSIDGALTRTSPLGSVVTEAMRASTGAHVALTTASSIREPLPRGEIAEEQLRASLPYTNLIVTFEMTGAKLLELLGASLDRRGTDLFCQVAGLRFREEGNKDLDVLVLRDPRDPLAGMAPLSLTSLYRVAVTDFQARFAEPYRTLLSGLKATETGLSVRDEVKRVIARRRTPSE